MWGRPMIEVINDLNDRVETLETIIDWDKHLRAKNPALQDLYEKYQATKKLIGNE